MSILLSIPVLFKVLLSLALILAVNRLTRQLFVAVLAGTAALGLWCGHAPERLLAIAADRLFSRDNLMLMLIVLQVIWLSSQMSATGVMRDLVAAVNARVSRRASMAVLPAVIGWLPMPGGALFSAPMVDQCDPAGEVEPLLKARINYWFRHIWEYWWPLYPGVIVAMDLTGLDAWQFALLQMPLCLASIAGGTLFLLRRVPSEASPENRENPSSASAPATPFLPLVMPVVLVVAVYGALKLAVPSLANWNKYAPMVIGLAVALAWLQSRRPLPAARWREILINRKTLFLAVIVATIRVYGAFIEANLPDGTPLAARMHEELAAWGIPTLLVIVLIPYICGLVTGIAVGFVGTSFPIVLGLLGPNPDTPTILATTVLAFGFGYIGMILSPVHVCLIVTNEHFKTHLGHSIAGLIKPSLVVLAMAIVMHLAIRMAWVA